MSKRISEEEFIERVKNIDWSNTKLKFVPQDKIDILIEKLDKIIDLLTVTIPTVSKKDLSRLKPKVVLLSNEGDQDG